MRYKRVAVLLGGLSAEREVSLSSGRAVAAGLRQRGYDVVEIDVGRDLASRLASARVDAAYIALHGRFGEDGTVQGLLELLGIPYTGSAVLASALAMDKLFARHVLAAAGIPVPRGCALPTDGGLPPGFAPPLVFKPSNEGSSVGISIVREAAAVAPAIAEARRHGSRILVEEFVAGCEVTVGVLDGEVLGALEVEPHRDFYDYKAKYVAGGSTHIPPRLPAPRIREAELGRRAYVALGCSGAARVDCIVPEDAPAVVLEVNTIPGMTELSLLPEIAKAAGLPFDALVARIAEGAALHVAAGRA